MGRETIKVKVKNETDHEIKNVSYQHRYDSDHYDNSSTNAIPKGETWDAGIATYWVGFGRTGYDYWWIKFERNDKFYTCKSNFYCFLTSEDAESSGEVTLKLTNDNMTVSLPKSGECSVSLYRESK